MLHALHHQAGDRECSVTEGPKTRQTWRSRLTDDYSYQAEESERQILEFVGEILTDPSRLTQGLERMLKSEREPSAGDDEAS